MNQRQCSPDRSPQFHRAMQRPHCGVGASISADSSTSTISSGSIHSEHQKPDPPVLLTAYFGASKSSDLRSLPLLLLLWECFANEQLAGSVLQWFSIMDHCFEIMPEGGVHEVPRRCEAALVKRRHTAAVDLNCVHCHEWLRGGLWPKSPPWSIIQIDP
jgi:hypothetical protein